MLKSIGSYSMATKASGTLVLIIAMQYASWGLMVTASPALELHFWCQLRIASARPFLGPVGPMCQNGGSCVCRAVLWLVIGLHTVQWIAEACLAAAGLMYCGMWVQVGLMRCPAGVLRMSQRVRSLTVRRRCQRRRPVGPGAAWLQRGPMGSVCPEPTIKFGLS